MSSFRCPGCGSKSCGGCDREDKIVSAHRRIDRWERSQGILRRILAKPNRDHRLLSLEEGMKLLEDHALPSSSLDEQP